MKKLILTASSLCIINAAKAQDLKETQVPDLVKQSFSKVYPNIKVEAWEKAEANYEAEFLLNNVECSALFSEHGNFIELEQEIVLTDLPKAAIFYCNLNYKDYKMNEAAVITDVYKKATYEVELKKGKEKFDLLFDEQGNFLKKEEDEILKNKKD
jgi:alpha-L-arabinofuranosidase